MQIRKTGLEKTSGVRLTFCEGGVQASVETVLSDWEARGSLARQFWQSVQQCPGPVFWEHPAWRADALSRLYECVLLPAPALLRMTADRATFAEHFTGNSIAAFASLGGDAFLLAPKPMAEKSDFIDLYRFASAAPEDVQLDLLCALAPRVRQQLASGQPRWLSTSGLGVGWLHVRIDSRPKYYQYGPYRTRSA